MLALRRLAVQTMGRGSGTSKVAAGAGFREFGARRKTQPLAEGEDKPGYRKKILRKHDREITKAMRERNKLHEAKAAALGLGWRTVCATVLHRYPVITPDNEPWEEEMYDVQEELADFQRDWLMEQLGDTDANLIGEEQQSYEEIVGSMPFEPASRVTEADKTNDRRSPNRKLANSGFLLVKRNREDNSWQFPQGKINEEKDGASGRAAAERVIDRAVGKVNRFFISNAPIGHFCYPYPADVQEQRNEYGAKVFFWRCQLITGTVKLETRLYKDFAWVARDEIGEYVKDEETAAFLSAVLPH